MEALLKEIDRLKQRNLLLEEEIRVLTSILFGRSSEKKIAPGPMHEQPFLPVFNEAEVAPAAKPEKPEEKKISVHGHERAKPGRRPISPLLPRVQVEVDLSEDEKIAPCGCPMVRIGSEITERLDIVPAKVQVIQTIRYQYGPPVCSCPIAEEVPGEVKIAPVPPQIIPQGIVTAGLLAHVVVAKYADGLPLYRQEQQFIRLGLDINRNTLACWVIQVAVACYRLMELLMEEVLRGPVINRKSKVFWISAAGLLHRKAYWEKLSRMLSTNGRD